MDAFYLIAAITLLACLGYAARAVWSLRRKPDPEPEAQDDPFTTALARACKRMERMGE